MGRPGLHQKKARAYSKGSLEELPFELGPGGIDLGQAERELWEH